MFLRTSCIIALFCVFFYACIKDRSSSNRSLGQEKRERLAYLAKEGITVSPSLLGVYTVPQTEGTGASLQFGDTVTINYKSYLLNGTQFANLTETFILGEHDDGLTDFKTVAGVSVANDDDPIPGVDNGIWQMKEGGKARLVIPSTMAYGNLEKTDVPAYSTIVVDVEIAKVKTGTHPSNLCEPFVDSTYTPLGVPVFYKEKGTGTKLTTGKTATVRYSGYLGDNYLFYSSVIVKEELKVVVNNGDLVSGLDEAILMMRIGDKCRVVIPYDKNDPITHGYGAVGLDPFIPPYAMIYFDVEILK